jgi:hypothetical protein
MGRKKVLFFPSAGENHAFLSYLDYNVQIFSDSAPKTHEERSAFFRNFCRKLPKAHKTIIATTRARVFGVNRCVHGGFEKTGVLFFEDEFDTLNRLIRTGLPISCYIQGEGVCKRQFFQRVLENMNPGGMRYVGTYSPYHRIHDMIMQGRVGDEDEIRIAGTRYILTVTRDRVWGVPDAREVFIQRGGIDMPPGIFADEVRIA